MPDILIGGVSLIVIIEVLVKAIKATGRVGNEWLPFLQIVLGAALAYAGLVSGVITGPVFDTVIAGGVTGAATAGLWSVRKEVGLRF